MITNPSKALAFSPTGRRQLLALLRKLTPTIFVLFASASAFPVCANDVVDVIAELGGIGHDMVIDEDHNQVYVSITDLNEVAVVSMETWQVVDRIFVGSRPTGMDLSGDGSTLYIALNGSGAVAVLDIESRDVEEIGVAGLLDDPRTWDVMEGLPGEVFVTSNPGSSGLAYVVRIDTNNDSATRVASNRIIRASPTLQKDDQNLFMYVGEGFSPNSLYKLDIRDPAAPIVLEDDHGSVSGTTVSLDVNSEGNRIYTGSGQVLRTGSFTQAGVVGSGPSKLSPDEAVVNVVNKSSFGEDPPLVESYSTQTFLLVDSFQTSDCVYTNAPRTVIDNLPSGAGQIILGADILCVLTSVAQRSIELLPSGGRFLSSHKFDLAIILRAAERAIESMDEITVNGVSVPRVLKRCFEGSLATGEPLFQCRNAGRDLIKAAQGESAIDVVVTLTLDDQTTIEGRATWEVLDAEVSRWTVRRR